MADAQPVDLPKLSKVVAKIVSPLNRFFDWLYHSKYNPLYRSGTLVVGLLIVLLVTGTYLTFFYSVSNPYQSLVAIQNQIWFGRWVRALHRYATDAVLIGTFFHVMQLLAQGKTWGPRMLAWISGMILLGALMVSAWSGYVMVWDIHGQATALAGAEMFQLVLPFLKDILSQAFDGSTPPTASFFFMNLFLHVALPLGMFFGVWIHTARLARTVWFPPRLIFIGTVFALIILSVLWPAPLQAPADLLAISGVLKIDWFYGVWLPLTLHDSPINSLAIISGILLVGFSIPFWWKPSRGAARPISEVDSELCNGCTQCVRDCPYEAISMIPHESGKHLLAEVDPRSCVSCGICGASCAPFAIGPPGRTGEDQLEALRAFLAASLPEKGTVDILAVTCMANVGVATALKRYAETHKGVLVYSVDCGAALHSRVLEAILDQIKGVFILACPTRNCRNRDGLDILAGRIYEKRVPFLARGLDRSRLWIGSNSEQESTEFLNELASFHEKILSGNTTPNSQNKGLSWPHVTRATLATALMLCGIAKLSQISIGAPVNHSVLRLGAKLPGYVEKNCHSLSPKELEALPVHMRQPKVCDTKILNYNLSIAIDGRNVTQTTVRNSRERTDRPLIVSESVNVLPGSHNVDILLTPEDSSEIENYSFAFTKSIKFEAGKIAMVSFDPSTQRLGLVMQATRPERMSAASFHEHLQDSDQRPRQLLLGNNAQEESQ